MLHRRITAVVLLLAAWTALAAWQYREYQHECHTARETLRRQADSLMNALVGGIRSHRRLGSFLEEQIQGVLDELTKSKDVLAATVTNEQGRVLLASGDTSLLDPLPPLTVGDNWNSDGLQFVAQFRLAQEAAGPGRGRGIGSGGGFGGGPGGGRGFGRGPRAEPEPEPSSPLAAGGQFAAVLLLERTRADQQIERAAWSRATVVAAGAIVLFCVAFAWRATVRLAETRGRAEVLETESRHLRELGQAAAGLAHETRNPLGLIRGWTQRLSESDFSAPEQQQQARAVVEECDRVTSRINQFLAFARPSEPRPEAIDAGPLFDELAALLQPDLEAKRLTLQRSASASTIIRADRELLRQALFNLVQNAVQMSPDGAAVEIAIGPGQGGKRIAVADRGPGVSAHAVASLFTPYFTTRANGTGLGLAIVRRIAAAHGWQSGYAPRPGGGSVFWLDGMHG